jgi:hypothetical protein
VEEGPLVRGPVSKPIALLTNPAGGLLKAQVNERKARLKESHHRVIGQGNQFGPLAKQIGRIVVFGADIKGYFIESFGRVRGYLQPEVKVVGVRVRPVVCRERRVVEAPYQSAKLKRRQGRMRMAGRGRQGLRMMVISMGHRIILFA